MGVLFFSPGRSGRVLPLDGKEPRLNDFPSERSVQERAWQAGRQKIKALNP